MGETRYYAIDEEGSLERVPDLASVLRRREQGGYAWIDIAGPEAADLVPLMEPLGLHPLAIEDCLDDEQVPKIEEFDNHTFLLFNRYRTGERGPVVEEVNAFLGRAFLVSVHSHGAAGSELGGRLERAARREREHIARGADHLLQLLLDDIVDEKFEAVEALQDRLDTIEDDMLGSVGAFRPAGLIQLRRTLLALRKSLVYEREILVKLCRRDSPYISAEAVYAYRDIYDHLAKFFEVVEICRDLVGSIMEIHLSMINNRMTMVANKTNLVMRRLTLITTVFMPLTLLAGIGGMSEWSMMTGPENWRLSYPAFLAAMAAIAIANYYLLRWLDGRDKDAELLMAGGADDPDDALTPVAAPRPGRRGPRPTGR